MDNKRKPARALRAVTTALVIFYGFLPAAAQDLPRGAYVPAKMPMAIVHPRPDSETNDWARHRKAYPDGIAEYRVPVAIQGGAYPFIFELLDGPSGMSIGETVNEPDYGIVSWTPQEASGPHPVRVNVHDQDGKTVDVTWSVEATKDGFIFVDPNVAVSGIGTKESPLRTFADMHLEDGDDDTFSGGIVYLRGGTHFLDGPEAKRNLQLENNWKPAVYLGYTGDDVVVDCGSSKFLVDRQDDVFAGGFRMTNARSDVNNAHFWFFNQNYAQNRVTFFEMRFEDIGRGQVGSDNPAAVTFFNPGKLRNYFTLWSSTIDDYSSPLVDLYAVKYAVIENNTLGAGKQDSVNQGLLLKSDLQNFSVRRNKSVLQKFGYGAIEFLLQAQRFSNDFLEASYNLVLTPAGQDGRSIVYNWNTAEGANSVPRIYVYRNTVNDDISGLTRFDYSAEIEYNVVEGGNVPSTRVDGGINSRDNLTGTGLVDQQGRLTPEYIDFEGTHGHFISGSSPPGEPRSLR